MAVVRVSTSEAEPPAPPVPRETQTLSVTDLVDGPARSAWARDHWRWRKVRQEEVEATPSGT